MHVQISVATRKNACGCRLPMDRQPAAGPMEGLVTKKNACMFIFRCDKKKCMRLPPADGSLPAGSRSVTTPNKLIFRLTEGHRKLFYHPLGPSLALASLEYITCESWEAKVCPSRHVASRPVFFEFLRHHSK